MCLVGRWRSTASCHCSERLRACPPAGFRRRLLYARSLGDEVVVEALTVFGGDSCGQSDEVALLGVRRREVRLGGGRGAEVSEVSEIIGDELPELRDARVSDEGQRNAHCASLVTQREGLCPVGPARGLVLVFLLGVPGARIQAGQ